MAIALSSSSDENNIAGTSSQISSEIKKGPSSEMLGGCSVCSDDQGTEENPLVYCDGCEVAVHQACYGIVDVPPGNWFCRKCESSDSQNKMKCELCPSKDGALKKTETGLWAHVVCALYIPEVRFGNNNTMEPIEIKHIQADRYNKSCYLCAESGNSTKAAYGAVMDCHKLGCKQSFHVTCAQAAGLLFEEAGQGSDNVIYCGYCKHHFRKLKAGNRKSTAGSLNNSNNNNTSSSYLDSASDSSQDNYSLCNTTEQDKNSNNKSNSNNNKLPSAPSNLSTSDTPQPPPTPSPPPIPATTATTTTANNSHSPTPTSATPNKTTDTTHSSGSSNNNNNNNTNNNNNNISPVSLTIPSKTTSNAKKKSSDSTTSSPQKKKRAPRKAPGTPSTNNTSNNASTLLASTGSLNNTLGAHSATALFSSTHVNNSTTLEPNASGDAKNNNLSTPSSLFMNDAPPSISTAVVATPSLTTPTTTTNSHSPVQASVSLGKTTDSKQSNNSNSSLNLTVPPKTTSRGKKNAAPSDSTTSPPEKKKRAPRKKPNQGDPNPATTTTNTTSNSSTLLTTTASLMNSMGSKPTHLSTYINNLKLDVNASGDNLSKNLSSVPSILSMNETAPLPTTTTTTTTNSHSPAQTSVSPSKTKDSKPSNSISLTIPLKSTTSRSKKKTPSSDSNTTTTTTTTTTSPPEKKKRAPRKKVQADSNPINATSNSSTLLATTGNNNLTNTPAIIAAQPSTAPFAPTSTFVPTSKLETSAPEDVYNWSSAASAEFNETLVNNKNNTNNSNNNNNKKKPCFKDDPFRAFEELRENTWSHLSKCVLDQAQQFDIPSLIGTLYTLRSENDKLVNKVRDLTSKRDQLVAMNARLDLPGPMLTQHLNNTSPNFSSVVAGLTNSPKGSPAPSPGSAIGKQPLISVVGSYNHVLPPGALGAPGGYIDRSSPLIGQPHSGVNSIKSSQISTPSPPIGALMAHCTSNRTGLIAVNPPYMSNVFPPHINTIGQLGSNPQGSPYYPRQ